jgi:hypothetical protein
MGYPGPKVDKITIIFGPNSDIKTIHSWSNNLSYFCTMITTVEILLLNRILVLKYTPMAVAYGINFRIGETASSYGSMTIKILNTSSRTANKW